jgi:hypothetical protein
VVFSTTKKLALALVAVMAFGMAPAIAQDAPKPADAPKPGQKVAKDQAEADLINGIMKNNDPAARLKDLDKWTQNYPQTAFDSERRQIYLLTYQQLNDCKAASKAAAEILKTTPDDEPALRAIIGCIYQIKGPDAEDLDRAEKASTHLIGNADAIYAPTVKAPSGMTEAQFQALKPQMLQFAKRTVGYIAIQRKDEAKAEGQFTTILKADATDALSSQMLAGVLFNERTAHPEKQPEAIFEFTRVGAYDGQGALPAAARSSVLTSTAKVYKQYHGSDEGWDKLVALAKANALPPDGWTIKSTADLERERIEAEEKAAAADPIGTLWKTIKDALTADGGDAYFEMNVKDALLPPKDASGNDQHFKGKLVSFSPKIGNPKTLVIAVKDPAGDVTLDLATPLRGKMEPGADLEFIGQAKSYTRSPYMLTFTVEEPKTQIIGWNPIAAPPGRGRGASTKKQPQ